jgi:hypothetical protein
MRTTKQQLSYMGVEVLEPETRQQVHLARAMHDFSTFCLHDEQQLCRAIIDKHMAFAESSEEEASSIGELQGGSDEFDIYRLSLPPPHHHTSNGKSSNSNTDVHNAAMELLQTFIASPAGKEYRNVLTFEAMRLYILEMCKRRLKRRRTFCIDHGNDDLSRHCVVTRLVNVMLILAFGSTHGQPRHIDHIHPNLSIFLFMSESCPSTIIYDTTTSTVTANTTASTIDPTITSSSSSNSSSFIVTNTQQLLQYWQEHFCNGTTTLPTRLQTILNRHGSTKLQQGMPNLEKHHFGGSCSSWDSIDTMVQHFGKLYQSVSARPLALASTRPGTTMVLGGGDHCSGDEGENHVHAGPPAHGPRMLCFAVGIIKDEHDDDILEDEEEEEEEEATTINKKENDGEIQYNPVLFHADLCCILFTIMDHFHDDDKFRDDNDNDNDDEKYQAKWFLIHDVLVPLVKGLCHDHIMYERLLGDERQAMRDWLQRLTAVVVEPDHSVVQVQGLVQEAIACGCIFHSPNDNNNNNKSSKSSSKKKMARRRNKPARLSGKKQTNKNGQGKR